MADKTVVFRPFGGLRFAVTGSDSDRGVLGSIEHSNGRYEHDVALLLRRLLRPDSVVADLGANIGVLTLLAARLCPQGQVFAFEPAPENHRYLCRNVEANGAGNVEVEQAAVVDVDGPVAFNFNDAYPAGSFVSGGGDGGGVGGGDGGRLVVPGTRLDTWVSRRGLERLDLVKVDVEGAEPAVLDGAADTIARLAPTVVVECNPGALRRVSGRSFTELADQLRSLFPTVAAVGKRGRLLPLRSDRHLELLLGHAGVVDLVGLPARGPLAAVGGAALALADLARLRLAHNRRRPPEVNYLVDPKVAFALPAGAVSGRRGETVRMPVVVHNLGPWWLSSSFTYVPVLVSYHWLDEDGAVAVFEGHRTPLTEPVGPGRSARLDLTVQLPAAPGRYRLAVTAVQDAFAWLDELDPTCRALLPVTVS